LGLEMVASEKQTDIFKAEINGNDFDVRFSVLLGKLIA
jgi:hypothetical protein